MGTLYSLVRPARLTAHWRLTVLGLVAAHQLRARHLSVRLDPILACNLRCAMCHYSDPAARARHRGQFTEAELSRIAALFFGRALQVVVGCGSEPTLHSSYIDVVRWAKGRHRVPWVGLTTNGQRLDSMQVDALQAGGLDEITLSVHGIRADTYERMMVGASHARLHEVLGILARARAGADSARPALRLNFVVNPDNLDELEVLFDEFGGYPVDTLQIRPMVDMGDTAYEVGDLLPHANRYAQLIRLIEARCRERGVRLLAPPTVGPPGRPATTGGFLVDCAVRYIGPQRVWQDDFNWRTESYEGYCARTGWHRRLLHAAVSRGEPESPTGCNSLGYDVIG